MTPVQYLRFVSLSGLAIIAGTSCTSPTAVNVPPVANAGFDQVVSPGREIRLDASLSIDPDGGTAAPLEYEWLILRAPIGSSASLSDATIVDPVMSADTPGTYLIELFVTDVGKARSAPDVVAITVTSFLEVAQVIPADGSNQVSPSAPIVIEFSEPVQAASVNAQTIFLTNGRDIINVALTLDEGNRIVILRPLSPMPQGAVISLTVSQAVRNLRGLSLAVPLSSVFSIATGADTLGPRVLAVDPIDDASDISRSSAVMLTFSEPVLPSTLNAATFTLSNETATLSGTIELLSAGVRAIFTADNLFDSAAVYLVSASTAITDLEGNALTSAFDSSFTTTSVPDTQSPTVMNIDPGNGFTDMAVGTSITVTFSEAMASDTVNSTTVTLALQSSPDTPIDVMITLGVGNRVATITPTVDLAYETDYILTIAQTATDAQGNALIGDTGGGIFTSTFSTGPETLDLDRFEITAAPTSLIVGEPTTIVIVAKKLDGQTNLLYQNNAPVILRHTGTLTNSFWSGEGVTDAGDGTATLAGGSFINGQATVILTNTLPDTNVEITATEQDSGLGRTGSTAVTNSNISWAVGPLASFLLTVSSTAPAAGETANLTITAVDAFNNTIRDYSNSSALTLTHNGNPATTTWLGAGVVDNGDGSGSLTAATVDTNNFFAGQAFVRLLNESAEGPIVVTIAVGAVSGNTTTTESDITWGTSGLVRFVLVASPTELEAGATTTISITAEDIGGNTITDYQNTAPITLTQNGSASAVTWGGASVIDNGDGTGSLANGGFSNGVVSVTLTNTAADALVLIGATENDTGQSRSGSTVLSGNVTWLSGALHHFEVMAFPTQLQTGSLSAVRVVAKDSFGNTVTDYQNLLPVVLSQSGGTGGGIAWGGSSNITNTGSGAATLSAGTFNVGVTQVLVSNTTAEGPITLVVTEADFGGLTGDTSATGTSVTWRTGGITSFDVEASPTNPLAGQPTTITITARDGGTNIITDYQNGQPIQLTHSGLAAPGLVTWAGTGIIQKANGSATLSAGGFSNGVATLTLKNDMAEGPIVVTAIEIDTALQRSGNTNNSSTNITWLPGIVSRFDVRAFPTSPQTASSSTITITAKDALGNTVVTHQNSAALALTQQNGNALTISWAGTGVTNDGNGEGTLASNAFIAGIATALVTNTTAQGPVDLLATEGSIVGSTGTSSTSPSWITGGITSFGVVALPTEPKAGESTTITITARDSGNNTITDYQNSQPILLERSGMIQADLIVWGGTGVSDNPDGTGSLAAGNFTNGVATVTLSNEFAEDWVILTVTEKDTGANRNGNTNTTGSDVRWLPNVLARYHVIAFPTQPEAGSISTVTITAQDTYGNTIVDNSNITAIALTQARGTAAGIIWSGPEVTSTGAGTATLSIAAFSAGIASVSINNSKAEGPVNLKAQDASSIWGDTDTSGTSPKWTFGGINNFLVEASPATPTAGNTTAVTITARDSGNNVILNYQNGNPLQLSHDGSANAVQTTWGGQDVTDDVGLTTGSLETGRFVAGIAYISIANTLAEGPVVITITEQDTGNARSGSSGNITWQAGGVDHYLITATPLNLGAGDTTTLTMSAHDVYDNIIAGYDNPGPIALTQNGAAAGKIWGTNSCLAVQDGAEAGGNNTLTAGCWSSGITTFTLRNNNAESSVQVNAAEATDSVAGSAPLLSWAPAAIDHFNVVSNFTSRIAGETVTVTIEARDQFNNRIDSYFNTNPISLDQLGATSGKMWGGNTCLGVVDGSSGGGDNTLLGAAAFPPKGCWSTGTTTLTFQNDIAEPNVNIIVTEDDSGLTRAGSLQQSSNRVTWVPGPLAAFQIVPDITNAVAGGIITLTITAQDSLGNTLTQGTGYSNTNPITLTQTGALTGKSWTHAVPGCLGNEDASDASGGNTLLGNAGCWVAGVTTVMMRNTLAEPVLTMTVTEKDPPSGDITRTSVGLTWVPGALDRFYVYAVPTNLTAGTPTNVTITAQDRFANTITTYSPSGDVDLGQNAGTTGLTWADADACVSNAGDGKATISASCWAAGTPGQVTVTLSNQNAQGPVVLQATDSLANRNGNTIASFTNVTWVPGGIDHFLLTGSPTTLPVNINATLTIVAEDQFHNAIPGYTTVNPLDITPVCGSCSGNLTYSPSIPVASGAVFDGLGQMSVQVQSDTALTNERFTVTLQNTNETGDTGIHLPKQIAATDISWLSAGCAPPTAVPQSSTGANTCMIALDASNSPDGAGGTPGTNSPNWAIITQPVGSNIALADPSALLTTFTAIVPGAYVFELTVTNACGGSNSKSLLVTYAPGAASPGDILITEIVTDPRFDWDDQNSSESNLGVPFDNNVGTGNRSRNNDQWVEIYNNTTCSIDLSGWYLLMKDRDPTEIRELGLNPTKESYTPGSSLNALQSGHYMIIGDPALNGFSRRTHLDDECYVAIFDYNPSTIINPPISDVELDPAGGNSDRDPEGDGDGDGAPDGNSSDADDESVYRILTPPYENTGDDAVDWKKSKNPATILSDNPDSNG